MSPTNKRPEFLCVPRAAREACEETPKGTGGLLAGDRTAEGQRDWPEDFERENGQYCCRCAYCGRGFVGHKRRVVCKVCAEARGARLASDAIALHEQDDERAVELDALRRRVRVLEDALRVIAVAAEFGYRRGPVRVDPGEIARIALTNQHP